MNKNTIGINDIVKVVNAGKTYTTFYEMACKLNVSNWNKGNLPDINTIYTVKGMDNGREVGRRIIYIESTQKKGYLVGENGLKIISKFEIWDDSDWFI